MSLIKCPECQNEVSNSAMKCPKCGVQLRRAKRGFFGKLFKFLFIVFNILMLLWLGSYWKDIGGMVGNGSSAQQAGAAIGATLGTGVLVTFWGFGDIVLGLLVLFTRPKGD
ncbi:MAG: zinc ribbon domain-containing protein [Bdellovibrionales bacterium]